jgi:hypothetical protein
MFNDMYELKDLINGVTHHPSFWIQANFSQHKNVEEWKSVFNTPFGEPHAYEALYYGKRDNNELEYRLVNSVTNEIISEKVAIERHLINVAGKE